jgi:hypothetical protein
MAPVPGSTSVEGQGPVMGAQVKTVVAGEDARLIIDRIDANRFRSTMSVGRQAGIPSATRTVPG